MKEVSNKHLSFYISIIFVAMILWSVFSYIQVEMNTYLFSSEIGQAESLCKNNLQSSDTSDLKYFKILNYNKGLETASIYCIFNNSDSNLQLDINKNLQWRVIFSSKLNRERGWYWPLYF
jgi:hypothetical protein